MPKEPPHWYTELLDELRSTIETAPAEACSARFPRLLRNGLEAITAAGEPIPISRPMKLLFEPAPRVQEWMRGQNMPSEEMMRRTLGRVARMLAMRLGRS